MVRHTISILWERWTRDAKKHTNYLPASNGIACSARCRLVLTITLKTRHNLITIVTVKLVTGLTECNFAVYSAEETEMFHTLITSTIEETRNETFVLPPMDIFHWMYKVHLPCNLDLST